MKALCELAAAPGLPVDLYCDESDDPLSRHVETLAFETQCLGLVGRVTGSHLTSMHSMDNYYVSKIIPLLREADLRVVANPLINITLQGRHDTYPKRRGMTRVPELMAAGLTVAFGHDCVMDPWYGLGSADLLEVAHMGLHVEQLTSRAQMRACFDAVTVNGAKLLGLEGYAPPEGQKRREGSGGLPLRHLHKKPQRLQHALFAAEMLPELPLQEHSLLELPAQLRVAIRTNRAGEVLLWDLRQGFRQGFNRLSIVAHSTHALGASEIAR